MGAKLLLKFGLKKWNFEIFCFFTSCLKLSFFNPFFNYFCCYFFEKKEAFVLHIKTLKITIMLKNLG